jgi:hypothetical protein
MPRVCSICTHPELAGIDLAIQSTPNRRIAAQYGLTEASLRRHRQRHLPQTLAASKKAETVTRADGLWEEALRLQDEAATLVDAAKRSGSVSQATQAVLCAQRGLALMATLRAQMPEVAGPRRFTITWRDHAPCPRCGFIRPSTTPPNGAAVIPLPTPARDAEISGFARTNASQESTPDES